MYQVSTVNWEIDQLVKTKLFPNQQAVLRQALRALFEFQPAIRRQMIIRAYLMGDISLGKGAELMGVSHEEMKDIITEQGHALHFGPITIDEVMQDANNA